MPSTANINDRFFSGIYQEVWKKMIPEGLTEAEADFIMEEGGLAEGSRVLDLMCGYGRHSLELAKRGARVTAIDNLPEYIEEIDQRKGSLPLEAICSSAASMQLEGRYQAAICMGNSFNFFSAAEAAPILQNIAGHLDTGGILIINTWTLAEISLRYFKEKDWFYVGDMKYLVDSQYHFDPSRIEADHIIVTPEGRSETIRGVDYLFTISEMSALLRQAGLEMKAIYATPRKKLFRFGDTRAYIVSVKTLS